MKNLHHKLVFLLKAESKHSDLSPTKSILKKVSLTRHGPEDAADHWQRDHIQR